MLRNSRILVIVIEAISGNSRFLSKIPYYVILGLDQRISVLGNFRRNFDEILDEIASSFVSLTPRNDGILDGILNEIAPPQ